MNYTDNLIRLAKKIENKSEKYVYHIKAPNFKGKYIYPLSELEATQPSIYKQEMKKYKGRENHPNIKIDILDCQWKDCINLSTLNPIKLFQLARLLGLPGYKNGIDTEIFRFNISDLQDLDMCLYDDNKSPRKSDAYKKIRTNSYKETQFIPVNTTKYYASCKETNEYPLIFGHVLHLMVKGNIPIKLADIIKFEASVFE